MAKKYSNIEVSDAAESDADTICGLFGMAFGSSRERAREYQAHAGRQSFQLVRDPTGAVVACAALLMTSHAFGGADVPAANIAHVAIAPEARGRGIARPFVDALCERARQKGALMVSLFASARPVYRKCGFERAGTEIVYEAESAALPTRTSKNIFAIDFSDKRLAEAYARKRRFESGLLGRAEVHWNELARKPDDALASYGIGDPAGGALDGYIIIDAADPCLLKVRDWYAADGEATEALLCFIGRFRSVYPRVCWHGSPEDDLVAAMPDKGWRLAHQEEWLARILEPAQALACRGYLPRDAAMGLRITRDADVDIDLSLCLAAGNMAVSDGLTAGLPTVSVEEPFFASLFTGFSSASKLMRQGRLSGRPEAVQLCDLLFAGPRPWVAEHF